MIFYGKHFLDNQDISGVVKTLKNFNLTQGTLINKFEKDLCKKFGSKYCSVLSSGTAALFTIADLLNWKKKDIVFCSPITFLSTSNCIVYKGAYPMFIDINKKTYNIDPNIIEYHLKKKNIRKNAKAIIATDFAGHPCDWESLKYLSVKYNLKLVNDNCHSIGSEFNNDLKYAVKYSDFVVHSYHAVKNITTGEGGAILTNNKFYKNKVDKVRSHGVIRNFKSVKHEPWKYSMIMPGYNFRLTDIQASLGISQLKKLDKFVKYRRKMAKYYDDNLRNINNCTVPQIEENTKHAYHLYPLLINFNKIKINKSKLFNIFFKNKIRLQVHYIPIYRQPYYKKKFNFKYKDFPIAEKFYKSEISLPMFYDLKKATVEKVCKLIKKII